MYPYSRAFIPRGISSMSTSNFLNQGIANAATKTIPFSTPKAVASAATKATKSFSLSSIINGAQKGINTLNQIIPLYNQVKPLVQNGKQMFNIFKNIKKTNFEPEGVEDTPLENNTTETNEKVIIEAEKIKSPNIEEPIIFNQTKPSKPFFV